MRSLKDRVILILETIIGKEELALLLDNEEVAVIQIQNMVNNLKYNI